MTRYVNGQTGMVRAMKKHTQNVFANVCAYIRTSGRDTDETGFGRTLNYEASQVAAIAEALERYGGMRPRGKRTVVHASYRELGQDALDPVTLGLHTAEQYARPHFPFAPYQPDAAYNWVWGYSFQRQRPLLVPECCAYYGLRRQPGAERSFVYEISNGCALGGCLEEAILYGMLEVAERDAFLLTWYAQLSAPRIHLRSAADRSLRLLAERIEHQTGYSVHAFNITVEHGIPCFWVMGVDEHDRPDTPKLICAAGSHLDPEQSLANALHELAPNTATLPDLYRAKQQHAAQLCADPWQVRLMEDHLLAYAHPDAFERVRFLYDTPRQQTFQEAFPEWYRGQRGPDLCDDLQAVLQRYLATGLDVIVVDQTTPEQAASDFRCVKVLIPGTLSMTFGHELRRTNGLERLRQIPRQLGYRTTPLTEAEINPYPHPFP
jgi:ribosomal protein S12 methylthiotransferase accessory factor